MFVRREGIAKIAVGDDGSADAKIAVGTLVHTLASQQIRMFVLRENPNASDCSTKAYAAYVNVTSTTFSLIEGQDVDIGVHLQDCGGWQVAEWHDHAVFHAPSEDDVRRLADQGATRQLTWSTHNQERWYNLLGHGLAFASTDPPSYYFSLYKTVDGNLRAYVRAGGPAYAAGMRSGDIVQKIDGQYWWEYGTYQSQLRAYDGKPHSFDLERSGKAISVQLGAPFTT